MNWVSRYLSEADIKEVEAAVKRAESNTSGEIVPVLVYQSGSYGHVAPLLFLFLWLLRTTLETPNSTNVVVELPIAILISFALSRLHAVRRFLTLKSDLKHEVEVRAEAEFYRSRIQQTQDSTGIMLFLSFAERSAVVLGDKGIAERCPPETWDEIVKILIAAIMQGKLKHGLIEGIERSGEILSQHFPIKPGDVNELPDVLVIKEF